MEQGSASALPAGACTAHILHFHWVLLFYYVFFYSFPRTVWQMPHSEGFEQQALAQAVVVSVCLSMCCCLS